MAHQQIKSANNNRERQQAYRALCGRYKRAIKSQFYFEALMIVYSMLEDRLKSFLYHCGVLQTRNKLKVYKGIKESIDIVVFEDAIPTKKPSLNNITTKTMYSRRILLWTDSVRTSDISDNEYLVTLKSEIEGLDIGGLLDVLERLENKQNGWLSYRNEIIHAALNKNIDDLNCGLEERVIEGYEYARFIDNQIKILRRYDRVRRKLRLQNN